MLALLMTITGGILATALILGISLTHYSVYGKSEHRDLAFQIPITIVVISEIAFIWEFLFFILTSN